MTVRWRQTKLGDVALVSTGPFGSLLHKSDYTSHGVPLVNPVNIQNEIIIPDPTKLINQATKQRLSSYILESGDVVVARRGEIGRCAVVGSRESGWICGTGCFFVRPSPALDPHFLAHLLRSNGYRTILEAASTGATMSNLSNKVLGELAVCFPPLPDQKCIVAVLDEAFFGIDAAVQITEKKLALLTELKQATLKRAFAGKLTPAQRKTKMEAAE